MDPKALASLDPKLRETYEKVMGTSTSSSTQASASAAPKPPTASPATPPAPSIPAPVSSPAPNIPPPANPLAAPNNSASPAPQINNAAVVTAETPTQATGLVDLQPTPTGAPLPASPASSLTKTMQPLPSPASINKAAGVSGHSSPIIRSLYVVASIIFLVVYTIFWLKIFKIQIPFLPF